jgi:hypothetical protein
MMQTAACTVAKFANSAGDILLDGGRLRVWMWWELVPTESSMCTYFLLRTLSPLTHTKINICWLSRKSQICMKLFCLKNLLYPPVTFLIQRLKCFHIYMHCFDFVKIFGCEIIKINIQSYTIHYNPVFLIVN